MITIQQQAVIEEIRKNPLINDLDHLLNNEKQCEELKLTLCNKEDKMYLITHTSKDAELYQLAMIKAIDEVSKKHNSKPFRIFFEYDFDGPYNDLLKAHEIHRIFHLVGGKNGGGDWNDYLSEISDLITAVKNTSLYGEKVKSINLSGLITDVADDIFYFELSIVYDVKAVLKEADELGV